MDWLMKIMLVKLSMQLANYDIELRLNEPEMTLKKNWSYFNNEIKSTKYKRNQLHIIKSGISKPLKSGNISAAEAQMNNKRIDNAMKILRHHIIIS